MNIIKHAVAAAALAASVSTASAVDLARPVYKAASIPTLAYNWNGLYAGLQVNYSSISGDFTRPGSATSDSGDGAYAGGQMGFNWQGVGSPWVFGIETDVAFNFAGRSDPPPPTVNSSRAFVRTIGTVRGRVGYAVDRALWYLTGGFAWADDEVAFRGPAIGGTISVSEVHNGWTIGGGLEWGFAELWTAKIEYLYLNLGTETFSPAVAGVSNLQIGLDIHTVKAGLNYRFGNDASHVMARY